jgi:hypothetical protein
MILGMILVVILTGRMSCELAAVPAVPAVFRKGRRPPADYNVFFAATCFSRTTTYSHCQLRTTK